MSNNQATLLGLPAELRNKIYTLVLQSDIERFADTVITPPLLEVCLQTRSEYAGLFYDTSLINLTAYYPATDSWAEVKDKNAKLFILEHSTFADMFNFWSLASGRRYCQRACVNREGVQRGIVTIHTKAGFRRWQWNVQA